MKKKLLLSAIIVVAVLVIGSIALILIDPFSGVSFKGELASETQQEKFLELLEENFSEDSYSYTFKVKYSSLEQDREYYEKETSNVKGTVTIDFNEDGYGSAASYSISGKETSVYKEPSFKGNKVEKETTKQSVVYISSIHTSSDEAKCFVDSKDTYVEDKVKSTRKIKTQDRNEISIRPILIESYLNLSGYDLYVTDNKYTVVQNRDSSLTVIEIFYEGRNITKIVYEYESAYETSKATFKFIDYTRIAKPKNASEYESVDEDEYYK